MLNQNVRRLRLEQKLTQKALGMAAGTTREHIAKIESGERRHVRPETLCDLARALGVKVDDLLGCPGRKQAA